MYIKRLIQGDTIDIISIWKLWETSIKCADTLYKCQRSLTLLIFEPILKSNIEPCHDKANQMSAQSDNSDQPGNSDQIVAVHLVNTLSLKTQTFSMPIFILLLRTTHFFYSPRSSNLNKFMFVILVALT